MILKKNSSIKCSKADRCRRLLLTVLFDFPHETTPSEPWFLKGIPSIYFQKNLRYHWLNMPATSWVASWASPGTPKLLANENFVVRRSRWHFGLPSWACQWQEPKRLVKSGKISKVISEIAEHVILRIAYL